MIAPGFDPPELLQHATVFVFTPSGTARDLTTRHFQVHVTWRFEGQWSVTTSGSAWNGQEWVFDSKERALFPLDKAVALAKTLAERIEVDGLTWAQWAARAERSATP